MKLKKTLSVILCLLLTLSAAIPAALAEESAAQNGMIRSIDTANNQITIEVMGNAMGGGQPGNGQQGGNDGQPPEIPTGEGGQANDGGQPPEKPTGEGGQANDGGQPPEIPTGEGGQANDGQQPPEKPTGEGGQANDGGQPPEKPSGDGGQGFGGGTGTAYTVTGSTVITDASGNAIAVSDLKENDFVTFTAEGETLLTLAVSEGMGGMPGGGMGGGMPGGGMGGGMPGGMGGGSSAPTSYEAQFHYMEDASETGVTQVSEGTDESIAWVSEGATVTLSDITARRTSSDSTGGDNSSFYGIGAAYLVTEGTLNISGSTIDTDAAGGAGVFAYGDGVANVSDTVITTKQGTSGGIHVAGGGTLHAENLTVETFGGSSAAIRSDRGSGVMTVSGGTYTSNGSDSPAVYSTADITVSDAVLTAANAEGVCIEGKNSLKLTDCALSSAMPDDERNDCKWSVILYQSMSGDSEIGNSDFTMTGGSLTSSAGGLFYTTNTSSSFTLNGVDIQTENTPDFFLKCTGNGNKRGWGSAGSNGANCTFTAIAQQMNGDILWDSISTLELSITEGSILTGAILDDESNAGNGGEGYANVLIDASSSWVVTGDSAVTSLTAYGEITDQYGKTVPVVGTDGTVYVAGDSGYTVTVGSFAQ